MKTEARTVVRVRIETVWENVHHNVDLYERVGLSRDGRLPALPPPANVSGYSTDCRRTRHTASGSTSKPASAGRRGRQ
jgi:hypothetical protein